MRVGEKRKDVMEKERGHEKPEEEKTHPHSSIFPFLSILKIASNAQCTFTIAESQSGFRSWAQVKSSVSRVSAVQVFQR